MSVSTTTPSNALSAVQSTSAASTLDGPATTTLSGPNQPTSTSTDSAVTTSRSASPVGNASAKRLSDGAVAGIAIGTFVLGALLATAFLALWQKGRSKNRKSSRERGLVSHRARDRPNEKSGFADGTIVTGANEFDHDRLFPQPLDDAAVKGHVQNLFTQIDGHVENFYTDSTTGVSPIRTDDGISQALLNPQQRLFAIKRVITQSMLESISESCGSERTFLPGGFTSIARRLKEKTIHDHANALAWSRFRTSFTFLLRHNSGTESTRLDQAIYTVSDLLNQKIQPFEITDGATQRKEDLIAVCKASAALGQLLLSQPALWYFEWSMDDGKNTNDARAAGFQMVYFPALVRLTDNKARKLPSPYVAMAGKAIR